MQFEWDPKKAEHNLKKHAVDFMEASSVFYDPLSVTYPDPMHSIGEERHIIIGLSANNRLLIVSHLDHEDRIRIISARPTTRNERKLYES